MLSKYDFERMKTIIKDNRLLKNYVIQACITLLEWLYMVITFVKVFVVVFSDIGNSKRECIIRFLYILQENNRRAS